MPATAAGTAAGAGAATAVAMKRTRIVMTFMVGKGGGELMVDGGSSECSWMTGYCLGAEAEAEAR
jgi:hypothetical protein